MVSKESSRSDIKQQQQQTKQKPANQTKTKQTKRSPPSVAVCWLVRRDLKDSRHQPLTASWTASLATAAEKERLSSGSMTGDGEERGVSRSGPWRSLSEDSFVKGVLGGVCPKRSLCTVLVTSLGQPATQSYMALYTLHNVISHEYIVRNSKLGAKGSYTFLSEVAGIWTLFCRV